jgi:Domain of unknown function (DUF4232)
MTLRRTVPAGMAAAGLAMVVAAVAGCSAPSSSSSNPGSAAVTASVPATSSAAAATSFASAGSASSAAVNQNASGGLPGCASRDLKATVGIAQGAAGSVYQVIDFTNIGTSSCSLYGYPGVALAGGSPVTQIGAPATRSTASAPKLVSLAAGASANTLVQITEAENYPTSRCGPTPSTYLQIYPPNQTTPIYLAYKSMGCSSTKVKLLTVSVMLAGKGSGS